MPDNFPQGSLEIKPEPEDRTASLLKALEKIKKVKHIKGCSESSTKYTGYCNCPVEIAMEALKVYEQKT